MPELTTPTHHIHIPTTPTILFSPPSACTVPVTPHHSTTPSAPPYISEPASLTPPFANSGAHTALRTIRRFLESDTQRSFDAILLVLRAEAEIEAYRRIAPLYFPRTPEEATAGAVHLPDNLGDAHGEIVDKERRMRVALTPGNTSDDPVPIVIDEDAEALRR